MGTNVDLRELAIDRGGPSGKNMRPRRHVLTRYVLPLVLILGFLSLVAWASRDFFFPPNSVTVMPVFSRTAAVQEEGTALFKAAGWIEPRPTPVRVAALAPGVVESLLVVEDQAVVAGEPIAELVKDDARLNHESALADVELREAELDVAKAGLAAAISRYEQPVHLEAVLGEAEASLARVQTQLKNLPFELRRAEADHEAMKKDHAGKLEAKAVVARIRIDIAESELLASEALVEELRDRSDSLRQERTALGQRRDALRTQLDLRTDEIRARDEATALVKAAAARVTRAQVVVAEAQLQRERMTIVAPIDGRVFHLIAHPGARIGSGMTQMVGHDGSTVITMYRPDRLQIRVDTRFEDIPQVSLNQPVEIDNPALSSPLMGRVLFVSSEADIQKNTLQVKVNISDPPPIFKPEMLVDVTFLAPERPDHSAEPSQELKLFVLQHLIHDGQDGSFVWVADQSEGVARRTHVETGRVDSNGLVEITSGLTITSRLIFSGTEGLTDGDRITVSREEPSAGTGRPVRKNGDSEDVMPPAPGGDNE